LHWGLLRIASLLVPARQRAEWWREWRGELWHVQQVCTPKGSVTREGERKVAAFCLGAFQDALCLRRPGGRQERPFAETGGTARQCTLVVAALLAASYAAALLLPGVKAERSLWPRKVNPNLVLIEQTGSSGSRPTISAQQLQSWEGRRQKYFDGFAFYRVTHESVEAESPSSGPHDKARWGVARASANFFTLLGMPVRFGGAGPMFNDGLAPVILSERVWRRQFGADPNVAGVEVHLGLRTVRVAGVAPDASLGLPGNVDAWLLDPNAETGPGGRGYAIAHLTAAGAVEMWTSCVHITASEPDDAEDDLMGIALGEWRPTPQSLYWFAIFLAMLCLPAITSVSLGECSMNMQRTSWLRKLYRWSFFGLKIALLLPIVYFLSLDMAYGCTAIGCEQAVYIQLSSTFAMCLFGMRWVMKDHRQRCPVCLRRVAHPAQVGQASRTFLGWNGTEMMCMGGHTLLHVPSLPTSWFSTQRWLYLDPSWAFLFAGPGAGIENDVSAGIL
jgi:hypothetical protein